MMTLTPSSRAALRYVASFSVPYLTPSEWETHGKRIRRLKRNGLVVVTKLGGGWVKVVITEDAREAMKERVK